MKKSTTYFVSSFNGNDENDGLSENTAFKSLNKINEIELAPGDKVFLLKGSVFENEFLHLKNCGDIKKCASQQQRKATRTRRLTFRKHQQRNDEKADQKPDKHEQRAA